MYFFSIEVMDKDDVGKDKSLGRVEIDITTLGGPLKSRWLPLQVRTTLYSPWGGWRWISPPWGDHSRAGGSHFR